jgi:polyferredoxin
MSVSPVRNPTFVTLSDGTIRNTYDLRLRNKLGEDRTFLVTLTSGARLNIAAEGHPDTVVTVPANQTLTQRIYVTAPPGTDAALAARTDLRLWVVDTQSNDRIWHDTIFNGTGK